MTTLILLAIVGLGVTIGCFIWRAERDFVASLTDEEAGNYPGPM